MLSKCVSGAQGWWASYPIKNSRAEMCLNPDTPNIPKYREELVSNMIQDFFFNSKNR